MYIHNNIKYKLAKGRSVLYINATLATMDGALAYGLIADGAIVAKDGKIIWVGPLSNLPKEFTRDVTVDLGGRLVTPALIDCHTHVVSFGNRSLEFEMRMNGVSYEDIARQGGGIVSTVNATRLASEDDLLDDALKRVDAMIAEGVSVIEVKSGYGLDCQTELRMLKVARRIETKRSIKIVTSFLGAHAIPKEYHGKSDDYIDQVCIPTLRKAHEMGLVDAVDGFCENIAFSRKQISRVFDVAQELGLPVKLHAEQLSNLSGAELAAGYGALSVDHIEYIDEKGVQAVANAGTVAVLLPGAYYTLRETQAPPIDMLRRYKVPMAVATDCNPGSSPMSSLLLTMNMSSTFFGMTPEEALLGVTKYAAKALGLSDRGILAKGYKADFVIWDIEHPSELTYRIGFNPLYKRVIEGEYDGA